MSNQLNVLAQVGRDEGAQKFLAKLDNDKASMAWHGAGVAV